MAESLVDAVAKRRHSNWRRMAVIALVALVSIALFEIVLRCAMFTNATWGEGFRRPGLYCDLRSESLYFQLHQRWNHEPGPMPAGFRHPEVGWLSEGIDPKTLELPGMEELGGRRPVLLFGDSYTKCMTEPDNCFEGWMERSEEGASYKIFNYGVRAYGIDQIATLSRLVIERWRSLNPIVVIGIYVDDDFDRAVLDFRGWPKPRFKVGEGGRLRLAGPVPTPEEYAASHPLWRHFYAWRWLLHGSDLLPAGLRDWITGVEAHKQEKILIGQKMLTRIEADLMADGLEHFYMLYPAVTNINDYDADDWREQFALDWLAARSLPYIHVRHDVLRAALAEDRHPIEYYGARGVLSQHLNPDGNEVAFRGLLRGLHGEFDRAAWRRPPHPTELREVGRGPEEPPSVRFQSGWSKRFPDDADRERVMLHPIPVRPSAVGCVLRRPSRRFLSKAQIVWPVDYVGSPEIEVKVLVDRIEVSREVLNAGNKSIDLDVDLYGHMNIQVVATLGKDVPEGCFLMLSRPRFQ